MMMLHARTWTKILQFPAPSKSPKLADFETNPRVFAFLSFVRSVCLSLSLSLCHLTCLKMERVLSGHPQLPRCLGTNRSFVCSPREGMLGKQNGNVRDTNVRSIDRSMDQLPTTTRNAASSCCCSSQSLIDDVGVGDLHEIISWSLLRYC